MAAAQKATPGAEQALLENAVNELDRIAKELTLYPMTDGYLTLLLVSARVAGWKDMDYDELAAVSGTSALFGHDPADFRPRYANQFIGMDQRIADATGFEVEWATFKDLDGAWQVLKESIDSGRPVVGEFYEMVMFVGYQEAAEKEQRKVYALAYGGPEEYRGWKSWAEFEKWHKDWTKFRPALARHTKRVPTLPAREVALRVLKDLVAWSTEPPKAALDRFPKAAFGLAGLDAYAANCANTERFPKWTACMDVNSQWTLRRSSAVYLRRVAAAGTFPQGVNDHLLAAAERYDAAFASWQEVYQQVGWAAPKDAGTNKERRLAAAAAALAAGEQEKLAIAEVEKALAASCPPAAALEDVPHGKGNSNSLARGLEIILNYAGAKADYDTIMGDTGQAFILQSEEGSPLIDGAVDVGWWPLATWGIEARLGFLGKTVGREIRSIPCKVDEYRADPAAYYRKHYELVVKKSIAARRPLIAQFEPAFVVTGYDEKEPPLLGDCTLREQKQTNRIDKYPWGLYYLGEEMPPLGRQRADLEALRHAASLGKDAVEAAVPAASAESHPVPARFTGQKSFALWAETLRDTEHLGQARWHANMVFQFGINRRSAVAYLRAMAGRHPAAVSERLNAAADTYQQVLDLLGTARTGQAEMMSKKGRETLAGLVERLAALDGRAIAEIEKALAAERLRALGHTLSEALCDPKHAQTLQVAVTEFLGTSDRVAAGELFVLRAEYELKGPGVTGVVLAGHGRHTGVPADLTPGKGKLELTCEPLEVLPGKDRALDIIMLGPGGELGIRLRIELVSDAVPAR